MTMQEQAHSEEGISTAENQHTDEPTGNISMDSVEQPSNNSSQTGQDKPYVPKRNSHGSIINAKCLLCGKLTTDKAIGFHLKDKHKSSQRIGETFVRISETDGTEITTPSKYGQRKGTAKVKFRKPAQRQSEIPVVTPQGGVIRVPVILEIPYVFGKPVIK